ncbi:MAG: GatB/YqeY domain-containing protein [Paludibacteraceae bacterium]|nr:GatB/YqeY domain-containing protein [Paludibacteraceae bacterium]
MNVFDQIGEDIKKAMLAHDNVTRDALRNVKKEFLEAKTAKGGDTFDDAEAIKIITKMVKKGEDAAQVFKEQKRDDLAEEELAQIAVLKKYLPEQLSTEDVRKALQQIIADLGVSDVKEMGKVMGAASKQLAGKTDNRTISTIVRELLG